VHALARRSAPPRGARGASSATSARAGAKYPLGDRSIESRTHTPACNTRVLQLVRESEDQPGGASCAEYGGMRANKSRSGSRSMVARTSAARRVFLCREQEAAVPWGSGATVWDSIPLGRESRQWRRGDGGGRAFSRWMNHVVVFCGLRGERSASRYQPRFFVGAPSAASQRRPHAEAEKSSPPPPTRG
jgi:hypothetical protein